MQKQIQTVVGMLVDIHAARIYPARVEIGDGQIVGITQIDPADCPHDTYLLPGFIDAHVHIESSLLVPSEFARLAVQHGTVGTISDPHEIANVCGMQGVEFMIDNGKQVPFKFHFGAPSCVPATVFETAGATISVEDVQKLLARPEVNYLSEMMNFPGVLHQDPEVMQKIQAAKEVGKPVDGHAPGLRGNEAQRYIDAGMSTDHECFTYEEAKDKLDRGMKILIREGSAAKNFEALIPLLQDHPEQIMFCSDDKHPDSLLDGHINQLCARALKKGIPLFHVLRAACINPIEHYSMRVGQLRVDDPADFIVVKDLVSFDVKETYVDGELVFGAGQTRIPSIPISPINQFDCKSITPDKLSLSAEHPLRAHPVIGALDGQLITEKIDETPLVQDGKLLSDTERDILKIVVINRYQPATPAIAFIRNFGLKQGALASSVAHDSHNIVAVGCDDESICRAVNAVIEHTGGLSAVDSDSCQLLPLPVAGLMSASDGFEIADRYTRLDRFVKEVLGSSLQAPFMTLSFMALLVIQHVKLSDKGLFDGDHFSFY
ncbi:MAG: adenine deaminase [Bacteroidota bacterium]